MEVSERQELLKRKMGIFNVYKNDFLKNYKDYKIKECLENRRQKWLNDFWVKTVAIYKVLRRLFRIFKRIEKKIKIKSEILWATVVIVKHLQAKIRNCWVTQAGIRCYHTSAKHNFLEDVWKSHSKVK